MRAFSWIEIVLKRERNRALAVSVLFLCYVVAYAAQADIAASICGDMVGKLLQVEDLLAKGFGDFSCRYNADFDPEFRFLPGPEYFYWVSDGACRYMYTYAYAYVVAPFYHHLSDWGHVVLNVVCLVVMVLASFKLGSVILPDTRYADILFGLASFLILPSGIYLLDFSEMSLSLAGWYASLAMIATAIWSGVNSKGKAALLFGGGLIAGLIFAFRSESLIVAAFMLLGIAVDQTVGKKPSGWERRSLLTWLATVLRAGLPCGLGYVLGFGLVAAFHQVLFGNALGLRGAYHVELASQGFSPASQLVYFRQLLIGGHVGLFTSLPFTLLSFSVFVPFIWRQVSQKALFFVIVAFPSTILIAATSPVDGGAQWSPRYLALTLPAYAALVGLSLAALSAHIKRPALSIPLALLCLYSLIFPHIGMEIAIRAGRQTSIYAEILDRFKDSPVVVRNPAVYAVLGRRHYNRAAYQCLTDADCQTLFSRLSLEADSDEVVLVSLESERSWRPPPAWQIRGSETSAGLVFERMQIVRPERR